MDTSTPPDPQRQAADLRTLQIVWGALVGGVALMSVVMGGLTLSDSGGTSTENAALFFYLSALLSMIAIVAAFAVQRRLRERLPTQGTYEEVVTAIRTSGIISLALLEFSALVACVAAFLSGEPINLLFVVPFFGFALVFFPTARRFETMLDAARRG